MKNMFVKILPAIIALFAGCQSGLYKITTSEDEKSVDNSVRYYEVKRGSDSFVADFMKNKGLSPDGVIYDEDKMPIEIVEGKSEKFPDKPGWSGVLWLFTVGIWPMYHSEYMTQEVAVKSPIGEKSGTYRVDAKWWAGWLPLFIGYPSSADERSAEASVPNPRIESIGKDRLIKILVGQFSQKDYVAFAKKENSARKHELDRIAAAKNKVNELVAENRYEEALALWTSDSEKRSGSLDIDQSVWGEMKEMIESKKEYYRVANKKADLEKKFAEKQYETVVAECDREQDTALWSELRSKAKDAIIKRDTQLEQKRIETQKIVVAKLLAEKKYAEVIALCDKEKKCQKSFMPDNSDVWNQYASEATNELRKIKIAKIPTLMDAKKYDEVIELCKDEKGYDFAALLKKASDAKYKQEHLIEFLEDAFKNWQSDFHEKRMEFLKFVADNAQDAESRGVVRQIQFFVFNMKKISQETIMLIEDGILDLAEQPALDKDGRVSQKLKENVSSIKGLIENLSEQEEQFNALAYGPLPDLTDEYAYGEFLVDIEPTKPVARKKYSRLHGGEKIRLKKAEVRYVDFHAYPEVKIGLTLHGKSLDLKSDSSDMALLANSVEDGDYLKEISGGIYYDNEGASFWKPGITLTNVMFKLDKPMAKLPNFDFKTCSGDDLVKMLDSSPKMTEGVMCLISQALNGRELTFTNVRVDRSFELLGLTSRTLEIGHKDNKIEFSLVCDLKNDALENIDEGDIIPQISGTWKVEHIRDGADLKNVALKLKNKTIKL